MKKYDARIDGGEGGTTTMQADSLQEALVEAIDWARDGDWPVEGCTVSVSVRDPDTGDEEQSAVEIISTEAQRDEELDAGGEVIAENEGEWSTEKIVVVGDEAYYQHPNGGARGSHDRQCGDGVWRERPCAPTRHLDRAEARKMMLDWGYDPAEVARKTACVED